MFFSFRSALFIHIALIRLVVDFFYPAIFRLFTCKCLFVQLKSKIQMQSQAALHYEFTQIFLFAYFTYKVYTLYTLLHRPFLIFFLSPALSFVPKNRKVEKNHRRLYIAIAKWAYMHISWMCYLFIFSAISFLVHLLISMRSYMIYMCANTCDILLFYEYV